MDGKINEKIYRWMERVMKIWMDGWKNEWKPWKAMIIN